MNNFVDEFVKEYDGKGIDFDGYYGNQCVDLFLFYNQELGNPIIWGNAWQLWDNSSEYYDKVDNPQKGDVVIWEQSFGGFGHVAIFLEGNKSDFISFDQNYPIGSVCHKQRHSGYKVKGFLRSKNNIEEEYMTKDEVLDLVDKINQHIWRKLNNMESPDMSSIHKESEEYLNRYEKGEDYAFSALYNVWFENFLNEYMKKSDCNAEAEHQKYVEKNEALAKLLAEHNELKKEITSLKSQIRGKEIALQSANDDIFAKNAEIEQLKKCEIEYTWQEHMSMAIKKLLKK